MWSQATTHSQSVGPPWTSDQPVAETSTCSNTQHSQQTNIHTTGGIQTRNPSKRAAISLSLRPRGHWVGTIIVKERKYLLLLRPFDLLLTLASPASFLCLAADRQFLILSNMAASLGTMWKCNVELSLTNVIYIRTYIHTRRLCSLFTVDNLRQKHTQLAHN
jgi:hypothetical protein